MNFSTYVAQCDRYTLVMLHGDIDIYTGPRLEAELLPLINAGPPPVIVDMCAVDFCDSWGLSIVVTAQRHATAHGVQLALVGLVPQVRMVFRITGVDRFIPVYDDLQHAVHGLTGG
jgi:anti-sigma B factor antagonist